MIVITTPTGQIGSRVLSSLLERGEDLRVVVRDAARLDGGVRDRVDVVEGAHDDPAVALRAFAGADAVLWVVPPDLAAPDVVARYDAFAQAAAAAVGEHGTPRLVGVTTLGRGWPGWREQAGNLSAALAADEVLESTGAATRTLAMGWFMENLLAQAPAVAAGALAMPNAGDRVLRSVAVADIAARAVELLTDRTWSGDERVPVVGPDLLAPRQMAEVVSEVVGHPVEHRQVPLDDFGHVLSGYGATPGAVDGMTAMITAQDAGIYEAELGEDHPGTAPTAFRRWCETVLAPAVVAVR